MDSTNLTVGAIPPPPGVSPNFINPASNAWQIVLAAALPATIVTIIHLLRVYTSCVITKRWYLDDFFITVALIFAIGFSTICIVQTQHGAGRHLWDVPLDSFKTLLKVGVTGGSITYNLGTLFTKVSILLFYLRFPSGPGFRISTYSVMFVTVGYSLGQAFSFTYLCSPMARYWDSSVEGSCLDSNSAYIATAGVNVGADIAILLLAIWLLRPLRMKMRQKIALILLFMTGGFVCAVSAVRLCNILIGLHDPDFTWRGYLCNQIWCLLELYTGIVCACLPCLKPLIKRHLRGLFSLTRNQGPSSHGALSTTEWLTSSAIPITRFTETMRRERRMPATSLTEDTGSSPAVIRIVSTRENSIRDWAELLATNGVGEEANTTCSHLTEARNTCTREYNV